MNSYEATERPNTDLEIFRKMSGQVTEYINDTIKKYGFCRSNDIGLLRILDSGLGTNYEEVRGGVDSPIGWADIKSDKVQLGNFKA